LPRNPFAGLLSQLILRRPDVRDSPLARQDHCGKSNAQRESPSFFCLLLNFEFNFKFALDIADLTW
jgi:hypothetical protein